MKDLTPVNSSNIVGVGHDPDSGDLHIQFRDGARYAYADVPASVHDEMLKAESIGGFFHRNVRSQYQGRRISLVHE